MINEYIKNTIAVLLIDSIEDIDLKRLIVLKQIDRKKISDTGK